MKNISFIIPVYNEQERINKTFQALRELQLPHGLTLKEVIFVNDGSTDNTVISIKNFVSSRKSQIPNTKYQIRVISYRQNRGKGYAIRRGMIEASGDYNLFFDADMSTPLTELKKFVPFMNQGIDVIVGTRKNGKSTVTKHQPLYRELLGKGFTKITQIILGVNVTDFTCGFKAFSYDAKQIVFPQTRIDGWGYDAELLFLAFKAKLSVTEKAVLWANDERTKVNLFKAVPQTFMELLTIHKLHTLPELHQALLPLRLFPKWDTIK